MTYKNFDKTITQPDQGYLKTVLREKKNERVEKLSVIQQSATCRV